MNKTTFIDYLVFEPRYIEREEIERKKKELQKIHPSVEVTEVYSGYWNEYGYVFSIEKVSEETALQYFEKERKNAYEELDME